jgi:hypothetical protein
MEWPRLFIGDWNSLDKKRRETITSFPSFWQVICIQMKNAVVEVESDWLFNNFIASFNSIFATFWFLKCGGLMRYDILNEQILVWSILNQRIKTYKSSRLMVEEILYIPQQNFSYTRCRKLFSYSSNSIKSFNKINWWFIWISIITK